MATPTSPLSTALITTTPFIITPSGPSSAPSLVPSITAPTQIASTTSSSLEELSLEPFRLNGKRFFSFEEIFDYIKKQPKDEQWRLTETLLQFRTRIVRQFEKFDAKILDKIEEEKAWKYVDLDQNTVDKQLESLKKSVAWSKAEANREVKNRKQIQDSWGLEVLSLFESSARFELIEVIKVVKKYPVYQDARNRINNLIVERLTDKNSKPTPQKVFTRTGDWTKLSTKKNISADRIPNEILTQLNIRLGLHDVLETGPFLPQPSALTEGI